MGKGHLCKLDGKKYWTNGAFRYTILEQELSTYFSIVKWESGGIVDVSLQYVERINPKCNSGDFEREVEL